MKRVLKCVLRSMFKETYYEKVDKTKVVFTMGSDKEKNVFDVSIRLLSSVNPKSVENFEFMAG